MKSTNARKHANSGNDAYLNMDASEINDNTVISRDKDGRIISIVAHNKWATPQLSNHHIKTSAICFSKFSTKNKIEIESLAQVKKIICVQIHRPSKRTGSYPSHDGVMSNHGALRKVHEFASEKKLTIAEIFVNPVEFGEYIREVESLIGLRILQTMLNKVVEDSIYPVSPLALKLIDQLIRESNDESEQHPVIPGRILFDKISNYKELLAEYNSIADEIDELNHRVAANPYYGRMKQISKNPARPNVPFSQAIAECGLSEISDKYNFNQLANVGNYLNRCYYAAKMLIHTFTAMREREAYLLKENCIEKISNDTYIVHGLTIKLTKAPRPAKWVTSADILYPYEAAMRITQLIKQHIPKHVNTQDLLFLSVTYLPTSNYYNKKCKSTKLTQAILSPSKWEETFSATIINTEDFNELVMLDPLRDWQSQPEFQPGENWRLTTHQFRRSMAVYAAQSGLVSLPSLKRMLQHTLLQMSLYYTKGFTTAKYLFEDLNPEIVKYFQEQAVPAEASLFLKDVIMEEATLHGAAGTFYERNVKDSFLGNIATNFAETLKKVKQGLLSYKETIMGGCLKVGECFERAHHNYVACLNCSNACIKEKKLDQAVLIQVKVIESIPKGTFAYNTEQTKLSMLQRFKDKISQVIA
ncbi:integrase [Pseudomonas syringae]|uniref:Integrase n=2 Tax=Pseudomonas syringae TaxID=317 RepID=A0AB37ZGU3_PSESX|nr:MULTISPECIES: integrase [Pseudomonas]MBI6666592.1 integrase [Pseudomonas syringae]MBI6679125.1 integrase [Pseudomonas syringae]NAP02787.1 integrase [Pseudomonas syringae]NAP18611.1 integrase [Pseudomonas syringae]NAP24939.1 integrase [Pseudomonas syringae]